MKKYEFQDYNPIVYEYYLRLYNNYDQCFSTNGLEDYVLDILDNVLSGYNSMWSIPLDILDRGYGERINFFYQQLNGEMTKKGTVEFNGRKIGTIEAKYGVDGNVILEEIICVRQTIYKMENDQITVDKRESYKTKLELDER